MQILLKSITMINFMGETHRKTEFNLERPTIISGANGLGKSRHMDAFTWLLFGKDSSDRENYEIKNLENGVQLRHCDPSVEAELIIDGELVTIKRTFEEQWVKPRGCAEAQFKGNQTKCMWNGVPVQVTEFQNRINKIIDAPIFKMLTNPLYFATLPWKTMREQLFQLVGEIDPSEIANGNPRFVALLEALKGKSLEDFKKELSFRKNELKKELREIQPRIDQTHSLMPASADFAAVEREISEIDTAINDCDRQIADITAAFRAAYEAEQGKMNALNQIRRSMNDIVNGMENAERDAAHKANDQRRNLEYKISSEEGVLSSLKHEPFLIKRTLNNRKSSIADIRSTIERITKERDLLRGKVKEEKVKVYDGSTICPVCGQELPVIRIAKAKAEFEANQAANIATMVERGKAMNAEIERYESQIASEQSQIEKHEKELEGLTIKISEKEAEIDSMKEALAALPNVTPATVNPETNAQWCELRDKAAEIEKSINSNVSSSPDTSALTTRKRELNSKRYELSGVLANRDVIERCKNEIARLEENAKEIAQNIADIEKDEFTIQEFTAANINECERRINGLFHNVKFRLFEYTIDGNPTETCVPLVKGVPFGRANTAGRINAGLDIINALCRHYDTVAPIFLDNAESVNEFIKTNGQEIMMCVTTDPELVIK